MSYWYATNLIIFPKRYASSSKGEKRFGPEFDSLKSLFVGFAYIGFYSLGCLPFCGVFVSFQVLIDIALVEMTFPIDCYHKRTLLSYKGGMLAKHLSCSCMYC